MDQPLQWLNYHHLLYFWTVARTGSIKAAAERLSLAQPTLSTQIHTLEENLGHKLFQRVGRRLQLTETGREVLRYAEEIFATGNELLEMLSGRSPGGMRFTVGVTDVLPKPLAYRFLLPALRLSGVRVVCYEGDANEMLAKLAINELDLVLSDFPLGPELSVSAFNHLLGRSGVSVFGAGPLARRYRPKFPASLDQAPFLLPTPNTALRRALNQWFSVKGWRPSIVAEFEDSELLQEYGKDGGGLFAAPSVSDDHTRRAYKVGKLGELADVRVQYFAISTERRIQNPAVKAIVESAQTEIFG
jgi:LysR family transcriptional activator of nhaA